MMYRTALKNVVLKEKGLAVDCKSLYGSEGIGRVIGIHEAGKTWSTTPRQKRLDRLPWGRKDLIGILEAEKTWSASWRQKRLDRHPWGRKDLIGILEAEKIFINCAETHRLCIGHFVTRCFVESWTPFDLSFTLRVRFYHSDGGVVLTVRSTGYFGSFRVVHVFHHAVRCVVLDTEWSHHSIPLRLVYFCWVRSHLQFIVPCWMDSCGTLRGYGPSTASA